MSKQKLYKGIHQLYQENARLADQLLWGRNVNRRGFLKKSALLAMNLTLGAEMVFAEHYPPGLIPAALIHNHEPFSIPGKHPDLVVLNDRPINAETPAHLLDDKITPKDLFFVRNNGIPPESDAIDLEKWTLTVEGEAAQQKKTYSFADLKRKFKSYTYQLTLECGGNGRKEFNPPAKGNQWSVGAVGCPSWTGVRLKDVLLDVGLREDAVYVGYYGADKHLSGDKDKVVISRGVPIQKALEPESLIAWSMNGEDIPILNGFPLRLVIGGWPASCSGKWLTKLVIRDKIHDGPKMTGQSYRVPCKPIPPGSKVADEDMCIIESMPVKSIITFPKSGATIRSGQKLPIRGHAWAGDLSVDKVYYSIDFGVSWQICKLTRPVNRLAWQHFQAELTFPQVGYYEVWVRAVDDQGMSQPMVLPGWNPRGYLNNACHRIAIRVEA